MYFKILTPFILFLSLCFSNVRANVFKMQTQSLNNLYFSFVHIVQYAETCFRYLDKCGLDEDETKLLASIISNAYTYDHLQFLYPKADGGPFNLGDDQHRMAVTGNNPNSKIYFNANYFVKEKGGVLDRFQTLGILLHEMGHHFGYLDTETRPLDVFAQKVVRFVKERTRSYTLVKFGREDIKIDVFKGINPVDDPLKNSLPLLTLSDGKSIGIFHDEFKKRVPCPYGSWVINHIWLDNLDIFSVGQYDSLTSEIPVFIKLKTGHYCKTVNREDNTLSRGNPFNTNSYIQLRLTTDANTLTEARNVEISGASLIPSGNLHQEDDASISIRKYDLSSKTVIPGEKWSLKLSGKYFHPRSDEKGICTAELIKTSHKARDIFSNHVGITASVECKMLYKENNQLEVLMSGTFDEKSEPGEYKIRSFNFLSIGSGISSFKNAYKFLKKNNSITLVNPNFKSKKPKLKVILSDRSDFENRISLTRPNPELPNNVNIGFPFPVVYEFHVPKDFSLRNVYLYYDVYLKSGEVFSRSEMIFGSGATMSNRPFEEGGMQVLSLQHQYYFIAYGDSSESNDIDKVVYKSFHFYSTGYEEFVYPMKPGEYIMNLVYKRDGGE